MLRYTQRVSYTMIISKKAVPKFLQDVREKEENECNSCLRSIAEISEKNPFEFLLNCTKKKNGTGGCSWVSCHGCLKSWFNTQKNYACPQCKVIKTFDIEYPIKKNVKKNVQKLNIPDYWSNYVKDPETGIMVEKDTDEGKKVKKMLETGSYKLIFNSDKTKVKNPKTGMFCKINGTTGKKVIKERNKLRFENGLKIKLVYNQDKTKVKNPETGRWCKVDGATGKKIIQKYKKSRKSKKNIVVDLLFD